MRVTSKATAFAGVCLLAATCVTVFGSALPAAASTCGTAHVPSDFNGDGIADVAVTDSSDDGFPVKEGGVRILYGTRSGLTIAASGTAPANQLLSTDTDFVAESLATGDFNGDGCTDLAIGMPRSRLGSQAFVGLVLIFYGTPTGFGSSAGVIQASNVAGMTGEQFDDFGAALATGDLNGDGYADLIVGSPGHDSGKGRVFVFRGNRQILVGDAGGAVYAEGDGTIPGLAEANDAFGSALAVGNFGDGQSDLAIGVPGENSGEGVVMVVRGSAIGPLLTATGAKTWSQDSAGILGTATPGDEFGSALATGSFVSTTRTDLAIGVPGEGVSGVVGAGAVNVLLSAGTAGLSSAGNQLWDQDSTGLATTASARAAFGASLTAGDFDGDGRSDLAVGIPAGIINSVPAGAVQVLPGGPAGLVATVGQLWSQASPGVAGTPEFGDNFGSSIVAVRTTSSTRADLFIGVPDEVDAVNTDFEFNGVGEFLHSSGTGLTGTGSQFFQCTTAGLVDNNICLIGTFATALA